MVLLWQQNQKRRKIGPFSRLGRFGAVVALFMSIGRVPQLSSLAALASSKRPRPITLLIRLPAPHTLTTRRLGSRLFLFLELGLQTRKRKLDLADYNVASASSRLTFRVPSGARLTQIMFLKR